MKQKLEYTQLLIKYLELNNLTKFEIPEFAEFPQTKELSNANPYSPITYLLKVSSILSANSEKLVLNYPIKKATFYNLNIYCYTRKLGIHLYHEDTYFKLVKKKRVKSIYDLNAKEMGDCQVVCVTEHQVLLQPNRKYPHIYNIDSLRNSFA